MDQLLMIPHYFAWLVALILAVFVILLGAGWSIDMYIYRAFLKLTRHIRH